MPGIEDFVPVMQETVDRVRTRMFADDNAGLAPDDPAFLDTSPGGFLWDIQGSSALEIARLWDFVSLEMVAAAFPAYAWGTYLDEHALVLGLERKPAVRSVGTVTFTGTAGTLLANGTQVSTQQTSPDAPPVVFETTESATIPGGGSIDVKIQAVEAGTEGNVASGAISLMRSPVDGIASLTNVQATLGGADVEADEALRNRVLLAYAGAQGSGTVNDYLGWALAYAGVGYASVEPLWAGAGTVRVTVTDADNRPVPTAVVTGLQALLDPVAGQGRGLAPIGAIVTVQTPTTVTATPTAVLTLDAGFSLDGAGGTVPVRADIEAALGGYINRLKPGDDVVLQHVVARFFEVRGVRDVTGVLLNGSAANVAISGSQVAVMGTPVLS